MTSIANLKIGTRLAAAFATLLALIALAAAGGIVGADRIRGELKTVYEDRMVPLGQIGGIQRLLLRNRVLAMDMMFEPEPERLRRRDAELRANVHKIEALWRAYTATFLTPEEKKIAAEWTVKRDAYVQQALLPMRDAALAGRMDEARRLYRDVLSPQAPDVDKLANDLNQLQVDVAQAQYQQAESAAKSQRAVLIGLTLVSVALGAVLSWLIARSITRPIGQAVSVARAVAAGDLTSRIESHGRDEAGQLLAALKTMNDALLSIVGDVRHGSESIATGSAQIASGNADLSQRTEEQAANLQQTAASMEQLTTTVQQNSATARQAEQLAAAASQAASAGGDVVGRVVGTMQAISGSSRKIADIIGVIDGIAFQTNILALNAAVEAARAGEQGRGFAVVASEVRALAQRSALAAREIKGLIEASVRDVETGSLLADDAGRSMGDIVAQVRRVTDLIAEISSASAEQTQGISQVGDAVAQLDQVTQQNAALVEESAAAASSLSQQAARLAAAVAVFKIGHAAAG